MVSRITPRKFDVVPACDPKSPAAVTSDLSNHSNLTLSRRGTRTSLTFRKVRRTPCDCGELFCLLKADGIDVSLCVPLPVLTHLSRVSLLCRLPLGL